MSREELEQICNCQLPDGIDFKLKNNKLEVTLSQKSINGNMQEDSSAFEGWILCLIAILKNSNDCKINEVSIKLNNKPQFVNITPKERQLYYRLYKANQNYSWKVENLVDIKEAIKFPKNVVLTIPSGEATSDAKNIESRLERLYIEKASDSDRKLYQQMPLGLFDCSVSEKNRLMPTSFIDLWELKDNENLKIYELKAKGNKKIGIISELLYYTNLMRDIIDNNFKFKESKIYYRGLESLRKSLNNRSIKNIIGIFLTHELHPIIDNYKDDILGILNNTGCGISYTFQEFKDNISDYSEYRESERARQESLLNKSNSSIFPDDITGGGWYNGKQRTFCLPKGKEVFNLYAGIRYSVKKYFEEENIAFWGEQSSVPNHILSSQVSCLNHLFGVREDKDTVLKIARAITGREDIKDVQCVKCDKCPQFIAFEVTSKNDYLNEGKSLRRGAFCTSIDAVILATLQGRIQCEQSVMLIIIEWKYTESYKKDDKSLENDPHKPMQPEAKGIERLNRYSKLITDSMYLESCKDASRENELGLSVDILPYRNSIYFQEPYYQLMRQTLWAEQMIKNRSAENIKATEFMHIHVVPPANKELLENGFNGESSMIDSWQKQLKDKNLYKCISPEIIKNVLSEKYIELYEYLNKRYYDY